MLNITTDHRQESEEYDHQLEFDSFCRHGVIAAYLKQGLRLDVSVVRILRQ